jgi:hypothetical protein
MVSAGIKRVAYSGNPRTCKESAKHPESTATVFAIFAII